jgi:hypothetical protein
MDHHCPWINNCVGYGNLKFFILFTGYVTAFAGFSLLLTLLGTALWWRESPNREINQLSAAAGILVSSAAGFFLWFAGDFFAEQFEAIDSNTTLVETYKNFQGANIRKTSFFQRFVEIFGPNPLLWLLPVATTRWPPDYAEGVLKETPLVEKRISYRLLRLVRETANRRGILGASDARDPSTAHGNFRTQIQGLLLRVQRPKWPREADERNFRSRIQNGRNSKLESQTHGADGGSGGLP